MVSAPSTLRIALITVALVVGPLASMVPGATAVSYGEFGSFVKDGGQDFNPQYAALGTTPTICSRDLGSVGDATDDLYYLNMDGAGTTVQSFDFRVTSGGGFQKGTLVTSGDSDVGQTFNGVGCTAFEANLRFLEADGLPGWTANDLLVWSTDATLGVGDVRIAVGSGSGQNSQSVQAGTIVETVGDADVANVANNDGLYPDCTVGPPTGAGCTSSAVLLGAGSFALRFHDGNMNTVLDTGDDFYIAFNPGTSTAPTSSNINDVYLLGSTFGSRVTTSSTDYLRQPELFTTAPVVAYDRVLGTDSNCDRLWIHFREYDGASVIHEDDVVLYLPSSSISSCSNPPPTSSVTAGTRVTSSSSHLQGTAYDATTALAAQIFYVDVDGDGRFDRTDPVYINRPTAIGGGADPLAVSGGDVRVTSVSVGSSSFSAGTIVGGTDADVNAYSGLPTNNEPGKAWVVRKFNSDGASEISLNTITSIKYVDEGATASVWEPATEEVYIDSDGNGQVSSGDIRLHAGDSGLAAGPTTGVAGGDADVGKTLTTSSDFRITGSDSTFDDGRGEVIYFSKDDKVNDEDYLVQSATGSSLTPGQLGFPCTTGTAACLNEGVHQSDILYFSWCPTPAGCPGRLLNTDIQVSPSFGTRVSTSGTDFVPSIEALPTAGGTLLRYNRGEPTSLNDDTFYLSTDGGAPTVQDTRLSPLGSSAAGTFLVSEDTEELSATMTAGAGGGAAAQVAVRDIDGTTGYTLDDHVYVDLPGPLGGGAAGALSAFDIRLSDVTIGGSTFESGSLVKNGDSDINAGTAFLGGAWTIGFYDDNVNGVPDEGDVLYAFPPGSAGFGTLPQAPLGAIRMVGTGGATDGGTGGGGGGGGGGGSTPPPSTPASVSISSPSNGAYVQTGSEVSISGTASAGTGSGLSVSLTVDGDTVSVTGTTSWSATFTPDSDGQYTISATAQSSSGSGSASVTINANAEGEAPDADDDGVLDGNDDCPNQAGPASNNGCPEEGAVDEQAREDAAEAQQTAEEARDAANQAQETAEEARDAANEARDASQQNSEGLDQILEAVRERQNATGEDGVPGPGALGAVVAVALAMLVARRQRR